MKKKLFVISILSVSIFAATPAMAFKWDAIANNDTKQSTDKEILFRDIPWGTNYTDVDNLLGEFNLLEIAGEDYQTKSIDDIIYGDYSGIDFKYNDINIIGSSLTSDIDVAGYTPEQIHVYLAYIPVNGKITHEDKDSSLYGAQYEFTPVNIDQMETDLIEKLSSVYGDPDEQKTDSDFFENKSSYTFWHGANDTELVLRALKTDPDSDFDDDTIYISYIWEKGDDLLQEANDILAKEANDKETSISGNGSTNGL